MGSYAGISGMYLYGTALTVCVVWWLAGRPPKVWQCVTLTISPLVTPLGFSDTRLIFCG